MATKKNVEVPAGNDAGTGADFARANHKQLEGAENDPVAVARRLHERGKAMAAKHGVPTRGPEKKA